ASPPFLAALLALSACGGSQTQNPSGGGASGSTSQGGSAHPMGGGGAGAGGQDPGSVDALALPPASEVNDGRFATASVCARCHASSDAATAMRDETGAVIAFHDLWRSTMMANSARDPFFRAVVSAEVAASPSNEGTIQNKCLRCHAPMAHVSSELDGAPAAWSVLTATTPDGSLARDGVSCAVCHQIEPDDLGETASFSGGFHIAAEGRMYGPHAAPFSMPMVNNSGFSPVAADHVTESALCASCHTLETSAFDEDGQPNGFVLAEQMPYLEWRASAFQTESSPGPDAASCRDCHVPTVSEAGVPILSAIARNPMGGDFGPVSPRQPFGRHLFIGGNAFMLTLLRDWAELLGVDAPAAAFDRTIALTRQQLAERSATVQVVSAVRDGDAIELVVQLTNLAGHKFPTGHPARRAWLRVAATTGGGAMVFRSGGVDDDGHLVDAAGGILPSELSGGSYQPHRDLLTADDQVYLLEATMGDEQGAPTYLLLRGSQYLKDSRLLPRGWQSPASAAIAPVGTEGDATFVGGGDQVRYRFPAPVGAVSIEVTLLYQSLSRRYLDEIFTWGTPETKGFELMWQAADRTPERVAEATVTVN
ncbi:MAG: hypothetical protein KC731_30180, partial [Myxococcales bacterium]|nr:hypothetical protein [Myxococcales bacterium]